MRGGEFVKLRCEPSTLDALSRGLTQFGAAPGAPEWLVSGVWLRTDKAQYLATATVEVLSDGFVARSLCVASPDDLSLHLKSELPDLVARLRSRAGWSDLPAPEPMSAPRSLKSWPSRIYSMSVLMRASRCERGTNRVACALLFRTEADQTLLVGTDVSTLAMVLSEDEELIGLYRKDCEELSLPDYLARQGC